MFGKTIYCTDKYECFFSCLAARNDVKNSIKDGVEYLECLKVESDKCMAGYDCNKPISEAAIGRAKAN